ncbi:MAG TPA: hypothetical protein VFE15_03665 [Marmoricola sp.]|jgi:hypothetical protein|nr:hypothetical protein [Marmoricola sp.]
MSTPQAPPEYDDPKTQPAAPDEDLPGEVQQPTVPPATTEPLTAPH